MRLLVLFGVCAALVAADRIEAFGHQWQVPNAADWKVERVDGVETLRLLTARPSTQPRRPSQYALALTPDFDELSIEAEVKKEHFAERNRRTSLILIYAWRDENHFNYAHLSVDRGREVAVHNGIFHVFGGDRVRISSLDGPATLTGEDWHRVKLVYSAKAGRVDVWVNDETSASMRAVDWSLGSGKAGIGSFFDMGTFRNVRITGTPVK